MTAVWAEGLVSLLIAPGITVTQSEQRPIRGPRRSQSEGPPSPIAKGRRSDYVARGGSHPGFPLGRYCRRAPPEGVKHPIILRLLMAKNIEVAVVCQNLETVVANAIPLIQDLFDFEYLSFGLVPEA